MTTIDSIAAAIADQLQLSDTELVSVSQVTVSITYKIDRQENKEDSDWIDQWYQEYTDREIIPF